MSNSEQKKTQVPDEPNLRPGPEDKGGHGGMATREQEARQRDAALATDEDPAAD